MLTETNCWHTSAVVSKEAILLRTSYMMCSLSC